MKWKYWALAFLLMMGGGYIVSAYNISTLAAKTLPKGFVYKEIEGNEVLPFWGQDVVYHMGQLQVTLPQNQSFSSGYIIRTKMPKNMEEAMRPFFKLNRDEKVWQILTRMNRALLNPHSPLRHQISMTMQELAVNAIGPMASSDVTVDISHIEPFRRLSTDEAYVYTAGGLITYDSKGLRLPMYCRTYFFPGQDGMEVLMLFTPDEGKGPLLYAIDDLASAAAKEEILGQEGYADLGSLLNQKGQKEG